MVKCPTKLFLQIHDKTNTICLIFSDNQISIIIREGFKKGVFITFGSDPPSLPPLKVFWQLDQFFSTFGKKCIFPFEKPKTLQNFKKLVLYMQNVQHIAQNASYTADNDSCTRGPPLPLPPWCDNFLTFTSECWDDSLMAAEELSVSSCDEP